MSILYLIYKSCCIHGEGQRWEEMTMGWPCASWIWGEEHGWYWSTLLRRLWDAEDVCRRTFDLQGIWSGQWGAESGSSRALFSACRSLVSSEPGAEIGPQEAKQRSKHHLGSVVMYLYHGQISCFIGIFLELESSSWADLRHSGADPSSRLRLPAHARQMLCLPRRLCICIVWRDTLSEAAPGRVQDPVVLQRVDRWVQVLVTVIRCN